MTSQQMWGELGRLIAGIIVIAALFVLSLWFSAAVLTPASRKECDKATGQEVEKQASRPWTTTVFHVSQTDPMPGGVA